MDLHQHGNPDDESILEYLIQDQSVTPDFFGLKFNIEDEPVPESSVLSDSPLYSLPATQLPYSPRVHAQLLHRPKSSKGAWAIISEGEHIRVTTSRFKFMRLGVYSNTIFDQDSVVISVVDCSTGLPIDSTGSLIAVEVTSTSESGLTVLPKVHPALYFVGIDIKLGGAVVNKTIKVRFQALVGAPSVGNICADSVSFIATQRSFAQRKKSVHGSVTDATDVPTELLYPTKSKKRKRDAQQSPQSASSPTDSYEPSSPSSGSPTPLTVVVGDLNVDGTARARAFLQYSDIRLKTDVLEVVDALETISKLQGVSYRWKPGTEPKADDRSPRVIGLIAQDVQKILPDLVRKDADGWLSVAYTEIIPILIEACKDLMKAVSTTRADIELFDGKLQALTRAVALLEARKEVQISQEQLLELQAGIKQLKQKSSSCRPCSRLPCSALTMGIIAFTSVAIAVAIILGVVLSLGRAPQSPNATLPPMQPPLPGTALCDDCNSLFAFETTAWSGNRFVNPSFENLNAVDSTLALGWEATEPSRPYTLIRVPSNPTPFDGLNAVNVSSVGMSAYFTGARQSVNFECSLPDQYISMINFTGFVHPWRVVESYNQGLSVEISTVDLLSAEPMRVTVEDFTISDPYYLVNLQIWQRVNFLYQRARRCITRVSVHLYLQRTPSGGEIIGDLFSLQHRYLKPKQ